MKFIALAVVGVLTIPFILGGCYTVQPGERGLKVTLGKMDTNVIGEGFGIKWPFVTSIRRVDVKQWTVESAASCYSSDLQQVTIKMNILFRIPEASVVAAVRDYNGSMFDTLVNPRLQEVLKEIVATNTAEQVVKKRDEIRAFTLENLTQRLNGVVIIADVTIANIDLSDQLEHAIEQKMVQEQEASKAKFVQQKTQIDAETTIIKAKADAQSIMIQGEALAKTPNLVQLKIVEKWDGKSPLVVGQTDGNFILPLK